jgi:hypothetical protein
MVSRLKSTEQQCSEPYIYDVAILFGSSMPRMVRGISLYIHKNKLWCPQGYSSRTIGGGARVCVLSKIAGLRRRIVMLGAAR